MLPDHPNRLGNFRFWKRPQKATSGHVAMMSLTEWFVRTIPFSYDFAIDHHAELARRSVDEILVDLSQMRCGCMCAGLSTLMARVARQEGYDAIELNFGNEFGLETHVVVLAGDAACDRVIYDPTFGQYSGNTEGAPVSIQTVIDFLRRGLGPELRWVPFGPRERPVLFGDNPTRPVPLKQPITQVDCQRNLAMADLDLFAEIALGSMSQWARKQRREAVSLFDCFRFPIGTSGEAEAEAIAMQLRALS